MRHLYKLLTISGLVLALTAAPAYAFPTHDHFNRAWLQHRGLSFAAPIPAPILDSNMAWVKWRNAVEARMRARYAVRLKQWKAAQAAAAARAAGAASTPAPSAPGSVYVPSGGCSSGLVHDLIVRDFSPLGSYNLSHAFYVANRESHCSPGAENPVSHTKGVFQFMDSTWAANRSRCGFAGASVWDAAANVGVAACMVGPGGSWGPWGG